MTSSSINKIPVKRTFMYKEFFVIELEHTITPGDYQLHFQFNGSVKSDYQSSDETFLIFQDSNNIER